MKCCLFFVLSAGIALGNVDILINEEGQVPVVGWTHNGTPFLMHCQEPAQPVTVGSTGQNISISLHSEPDSAPVLLAVSGYQGWSESADFIVFDLPGLSPLASRTLYSDEVSPPVFCTWYSFPILPRYADCGENRRMFMVMNTGYTAGSVQNETWMTTVSVDPWSSGVVNTSDTTSFRQSFFTSQCLLSAQVPQGDLPGYTIASGSWDGYPGPSYFGIKTIYLVAGTLHENSLYGLFTGSTPGSGPDVLASGYGQTGQICLWTDTAGTVWYSDFTASITEPESSPLAIDHDELPFAAAVTRTREDEGILLAWYDGANIMVRHWLGEWNGYAHVVEPWTHVSPGNIAVCSDTDGYWVAWKDDTSATPEYRFVPRGSVTGVNNPQTPVGNSPWLSLGQNPITAFTSYSVSLPVPGSYRLRLYDLCGRNLGEITSGEGRHTYGTLDLSAYPSGIYGLVLETELGVSTVRVLKTGR